MRAIVRRHRLRVGDCLVMGTPDQEFVSPPIVAVGEEHAVLATGHMIECPPGKALYIERGISEDALVRIAEENARRSP